MEFNNKLRPKREYEAAKTPKGRWALYHPTGTYDEMPKKKAIEKAKRLNTSEKE